MIMKGENTMSERDGDFGAFLAGFVIGGMIGAAVALLMAPQSGEETRTIIHDRSIELKDKAVEKAETVRIKAETAAAEARARADELAKLSQEKALELKKKGQEVYQAQKSKIEQVVQKKVKPSTDESSEVIVED
jgi:gas vesicle protein